MAKLQQETGSTEHVINTKSYNAQASVNESEIKFRNTMRQAPVGITILRGPDFFVEMANDTYLNIVGKREDEFVNRPLFESLPEVRSSIEDILTRVLKTAIPYNGNEFEVTIKRFGKPEQCYFNFVYQPLIEDSGEISGIFVVATEVTQQVLAKQRLERSENQFRTLVTQSQFAKAILKGPEFVISIANESMLKNLWGRELYEVLGQRLFDVFPELETQNLGKILREAYQSGKLYRDNEASIVINGAGGLKEHFVDFQYAPILETDDEVSGIMISLNDVTDKVTFRKQILEAAERLSLATDGTQLATWDLDLNTKHIIYS